MSERRHLLICLPRPPRPAALTPRNVAPLGNKEFPELLNFFASMRMPAAKARCLPFPHHGYAICPSCSDCPALARSCERCAGFGLVLSSLGEPLPADASDFTLRQFNSNSLLMAASSVSEPAPDWKNEWDMISDAQALEEWRGRNFAEFRGEPLGFPCYARTWADGGASVSEQFLCKGDLQQMLAALN